MFLLSVFSPLLGGLINASPVARFLGHRGSSIVAVTCMLIAFLSSVVVYYEVVFMGCAVSFDVAGTWFSVGSFGANWSFNFDILTANMLFTVTSVSLAVHMYACDYMRQDPHLNLFLGYLSFFTGFMCVLVAADNLLVMLVGWEGKQIQCPNGDYNCTTAISCFLTNKRKFYTARIPAEKRYGLHTFLFKQLLTGFLLGDGWLEKHGKGARLAISLTERFVDVAQWYQLLLYGLGYTLNKNVMCRPAHNYLNSAVVVADISHNNSFPVLVATLLTQRLFKAKALNNRLELKDRFKRKKSNTKPYYLIKTFSFTSLLPFHDVWYCCVPVFVLSSALNKHWHTTTSVCIAEQQPCTRGEKGKKIA